MNAENKELILKGIKAVPFGVALGLIFGLLFGFGVGCIVTGLSTLAICEYSLTNGGTIVASG